MSADRPRRGASALRGVGRAVVVVAVPALLAGLVLTAARLWQPASGPLEGLVIRLAALVPLAIPAYAVAALGALVLVRRRLGPPLLALALAGLAVHLWWFAPFLVDDGPAAAEGPRLRVLTVNALVHSGASGQDLLDVARSADADLVVVEEMGEEALGQAMDAGLADAYAHRTYEPQDGGTVTMIWSRFPLRDALAVDGASGCLRVTVDVDGRDLRFVGVHTGPPVWPRTWRDDHAALLADVRREVPDVLAGDFNATVDHVQLRRLLDEGLRDAGDLTGSGWAPTWPSNGRQSVLGVPLPRFATIDHVLVSAAWTVTEMGRIDVPRSDHTAVLVEVAPAR